MSESTDRARPGQIVSSPLFAKGHRRPKDDRVWVGEVFVGEKEGTLHDDARAERKYGVVDAYWTQPSADGVWEVEAVELFDDLTVNPLGEVIAFYMRSDYETPFVDRVEVHGEMHRYVELEPMD